MSIVKKGLCTCVAFTLLAAVGACGQSKAADVPDAVVTATADLVAIDPAIMQAQSILSAQCARTHGFEVPVDYSAIPATQGYADVGGIFRSQEEAETIGYAQQTVNFERDADAEEQFLATLTDAEKDRYDREVGGFDDTSCDAQAYAILFGSNDRAGMVLNTFNDLVREQSASALDDSEVQSAIMDEYVPCMAEGGYQVNGLRAGDLAGERFGKYRTRNEKPNDDERAMARYDYGCQQKARLMDRIDTAMERNAGTWMVSNEAMLLDRHETLRKAMDVANQVIAGTCTYESADSGGASTDACG